MPDESTRNPPTYYYRINGESPPVGVVFSQRVNVDPIAYLPILGSEWVYDRLVHQQPEAQSTFITAVSLPPRGYPPPPGPDDVCLGAGGEEIVRIDKSGEIYIQGHKLENPGDVVMALRGVALALRARTKRSKQREETSTRYEREVDP
jgi:hypothetical protein